MKLPIIVFNDTSEAVKHRAKTCTRRTWSKEKAARLRQGSKFLCYDKAQDKGGKPFAVAVVTRDPYEEYTTAAPADDFDKEGLAWMEERAMFTSNLRPRTLWHYWRTTPIKYWVVRFRIIEDLEPVGEASPRASFSNKMNVFDRVAEEEPEQGDRFLQRYQELNDRRVAREQNGTAPKKVMPPIKRAEPSFKRPKPYSAVSITVIP